jgi:hypothetical protein
MGLGLGSLALMPDQCRFLGYVAAALIVPAGAWLFFASIRGRKSDLSGVSGPEVADASVTEIAGQVVSDAIDNVG